MENKPYEWQKRAARQNRIIWVISCVLMLFTIGANMYTCSKKGEEQENSGQDRNHIESNKNQLKNFNPLNILSWKKI